MKHKHSLWLLTTIFNLLLWGTCATNVHAQANWFPGTGNVGIGTTAPDAKLVVTSNTGTLPASTGIARFAEADGVQTSVFLDGFNANGGFLVRRANTSAASPSAVLSGELLGVFGAAGYGTSAYSGTRARIAFGAAENWTNTANGTFITFNTTANGSATAGGTERLRINSAGNIGFGTSDIEAWPNNHPVIESLSSSILFSPDTGVHLNSNSYYDTASKYKTSGFGAANYQLYNGAHYWRVAPSGSADASIPWLNSMTLNSAGNVGIGTWSPGSAKLHITSGASGATPYTAGGNPELMLESPGATDLHLLSPNTGSGRIWFASPSSNLAGGLTYTHSATLSSGVMRFLTGGNATRMTILGGGNVGIGTETPSYKLHVDGGQINASNGLCIAGDCKTAWSQLTGTSQWTTGSGSNIHYTAGNVGIGTASPTQGKLVIGQSSSPSNFANKGLATSVNGGIATVNAINSSLSMYDSTSIHAGDVGILYSGSTYKMVLSVNDDTNGTPGNVMTLQGGGNVGIGTTTPQRLMTLYKTSGPVLQLVDNLSGTTANDGLLLVQDGLNSYLENSEAGSVNFRTSATTRMTINASGDVGVGTTSPNYKLDVAGTVNASEFRFPDGTVQTTAATGAQSSQWTTTSGPSIYYNSGSVGIGTVSPNTAYKLDVNGHTNVTGNINLTGTINAKYQDVAEWVPSTHALPAGTVVTLDPTKSNHVEASSKAYDTRVAGVVSAQPGIALGEEGQGKVLVATTGRVKIKVDASHGPIFVGDLLVSSNLAGVAMKSKPIDVGGVEMHRPGTLIGKALEPLAKGQGEILVLLSLQ